MNFEDIEEEKKILYNKLWDSIYEFGINTGVKIVDIKFINSGEIITCIPNFKLDIDIRF